MQLTLDLSRTVFSIGEAVSPRLHIKNDTATAVEFPGFVFDGQRLAFSGGSAAHLIGPDGQDLMAPYAQHTESDLGPPLRVEAGKDEWLYLHVGSYLHLRQSGEYIFWVELQDNRGFLYQSNKIGFRLEDVPSSVPPHLVELTLRAQKSSFAQTEPVELESVFTNNYDRRLIFLKPQEDSFYGWVNPVYQFTVMDSAGRSLPLAMRGGTMATPVYDDASQFTVEPGASYRQILRLPDFPQMRNPGVYRVRLTYIVRENAIGKSGAVLDRKSNLGPEVFTGRLESNELKITVA